jgi:hypothetical protein
VTVAGAGRQLTKIVGDGGSSYALAATVTGANDAELRSLSVVSDGSSSLVDYTIGIYADGTVPILRDLDIVTKVAEVASYGIYNVNNSTLTVEDSHIDGTNAATAVGIYNSSARLSLVESTVRGYSGGVSSYAIYSANRIKVSCSIRWARAEPVAGLAEAERLTVRTWRPRAMRSMRGTTKKRAPMLAGSSCAQTMSRASEYLSSCAASSSSGNG